MGRNNTTFITAHPGSIEKLSEQANLLGKRVFRLVPIEYHGTNNNYRRIWLCQCDCGSRIKMLDKALLNGFTKSCGCWRRELTGSLNKDLWLPPNVLAVNRIFSYSRRNARLKNFPFELTKENINDIIFKNCHYCGIKPEQKFYHYIQDRKVFHHGIDRVDSNFGYSLNNVVPCCKQCNVGKLDQTTENFLKWIERVYEYTKNKT